PAHGSALKRSAPSGPRSGARGGWCWPHTAALRTAGRSRWRRARCSGTSWSGCGRSSTSRSTCSEWCREPRAQRSRHDQGDDMSPSASVHSAVEPAETPLTPDSWGKLGMWIFLAGDAVGFGVLLSGYGVMRATSADWPNPYAVLGINLTAIMTFLLICSSVTMVKALEWLGKGDRRRAINFLLYTAAGGA